ncbi:MAG: hypothetical protein KUG77_26265 [Nannocystaceae bacterium]|nr:hypothetical protein [Nannocystaceae bacterium]
MSLKERRARRRRWEEARANETRQQRAVRYLYYAFLAFQIVAPFVALWFIAHDFSEQALRIAAFGGFFPALIFLGSIAVVTSLPGNLPRSLILCFVVPLELLGQVFVFGGGVSGYFIEAFAVDYTAALLAFLILSAREGGNVRAILLGVVVGGAGVAMFIEPLGSLYEDAHWAYWVAFAGTLTTAVWTFLQLFAEHGSFATAGAKPGPLTRWANRKWPATFPAPALYNPDTLVTVVVIVGLLLWIVLPLVGQSRP